MEPRLIGRGKELAREALRMIKLASMEPRLIGRGKCVSVMCILTTLYSFNGAATYWSRKAWLSQPSPKQPRKLQWSRDLLVAESLLTGDLQNENGYASMEPRLIGRGKG